MPITLQPGAREIGVVRASTLKLNNGQDRTLVTRLKELDYPKITELSDENVRSFFKTKDMKAYSDSYRRQLYLRIRAHNPHLIITPKELGIPHPKSVAKLKTYPKEFKDEIETLVINAFKTLTDCLQGKYQDITLGDFDTHLAIVLTVLFSLRMEEVRQLATHHIQSIIENVPIQIRIKQKSEPVTLNNTASVISLFSSMNTLMEFRNKLVGQINPKQKRYNLNLLVLSSPQTINNKVSLFYQKTFLRDVPKNLRLGLVVFRQYMATTLSDIGEIALAQHFNRHASVQTTATHYAVLNTGKTMETVQNNILEPPNNTHVTLVSPGVSSMQPTEQPSISGTPPGTLQVASEGVRKRRLSASYEPLTPPPSNYSTRFK